MSYHLASSNNLLCPSLSFVCSSLKPKSIDDKETCFQMAEPPNKCCFVRYRYHAECMLLDDHDKSYDSMELKLRAKNGWEDPSEIEIVCSATFLTKKIFMLMTIILLAIAF